MKNELFKIQVRKIEFHVKFKDENNSLTKKKKNYFPKLFRNNTNFNN
jgi:hypothetical protein